MTTLTAPRPAVKPARKPRTVRETTGTVRLFLEINGIPYAARILTPQPGSGVSALVRLRKEVGADAAEYHVARTEHGCTCDCASQTFDHEGKGTFCKHIRALRAAHLL